MDGLDHSNHLSEREKKYKKSESICFYIDIPTQTHTHKVRKRYAQIHKQAYNKPWNGINADLRIVSLA